MDIFANLPEKKLKEVMIPHYWGFRQELFRLFNKLKKENIAAGHHDTISFEEYWSRSVLEVPSVPDACLAVPIFKYLFNSYMLRKGSNSSITSDDRELLFSVMENISYLLNFESNYRKVLRPSEALVGQLTTTEVTPCLGEIQLPYPCVFVQLPRPIAYNDSHEKPIYINGLYLWEVKMSDKDRDVLHDVKTLNTVSLCPGLMIGFCAVFPWDVFPLRKNDVFSNIMYRAPLNNVMSGEELIDLGIENAVTVRKAPSLQHEMFLHKWFLRLAFNLCLWLSNKQEEEEVVEEKHDILEKIKKAKDPLKVRIAMENQYKGKAPVSSIVVGQHVVIDEETRIASAQSQTAKGMREMKIHWRRAHWRRVAIGEGRVLREWRWFKNVLVNKDKGGVPLYSTYELRKGV